MKFEEAMRHMLAGQRVRRSYGWDRKWTLGIENDDGNLHFIDEESRIKSVGPEEIVADDWELAE